LINYFFDFRFMDPLRRYSRSKSKDVRIAKNFGRFLPSQIIGGMPSKNYTQVITPGWRHVVRIKICDGIPIRSELIDVYTLNFKPNFKFSRLKFWGETPSQLEYALGSLGQSLARVKISGRSPP